MDNPPLDGASIDNYAQYTPGMSPYYASGVYSKAISLQHFDCLFRHKTLKNFKTLISSSSPLLATKSNGSYISDQIFCLVPNQKQKFQSNY